MRTSIRKPIFAAGLALALLVGAAGSAGAQQAIDKAAGEIFGSVMSPFCPGMTLSTCPSSQAADLREDIRAQLARGASTEEVLDALYAEWGEDVLGPRSALGAGLFAWLIPALVIVVAGAGLLTWLRRSSRRSGAALTRGADLDSADRDRLEQELAQL